MVHTTTPEADNLTPSEGDTIRQSTGFAMCSTAILRDTSLSPMARLYYAVLVTFSTNDTRTAFPLRETIAELMGTEGKPVTLRAVSNWNKELVDAGYLVVTPNYERRRGYRGSNDYELLDKAYMPTSKAGRLAAWQAEQGQMMRDGRAAEGRDPWGRKATADESPF